MSMLDRKLQCEGHATCRIHRHARRSVQRWAMLGRPLSVTRDTPDYRTTPDYLIDCKTEYKIVVEIPKIL